MRVACPNCNTEAEHSGLMAGLTVRCKSCGAWVELPKKAPLGPSAITDEAPSALPAAAIEPAVPPACPRADSSSTNMAAFSNERIAPPLTPDHGAFTELNSLARENQEFAFVDSFCQHCGTINRIQTPANPPEPPCKKCGRPVVPKLPNANSQARGRVGPELAAPLQRIVARLIDSLMLVSASILAALVNGIAGRELALIVGLGFLLLTQAYQIYRLTTEGQTIGKWLVGARVVRALDGTNPGFVGSVVLRYLVAETIYALPCVGVVLILVSAVALFSDNRETLHDKLAGTRVVVT